MLQSEPLSQPGKTFSPADISGLVLWIDAAKSANTLNEGNIAQVNDRSLAGNHVTQGAEVNQPEFIANGGGNRAAIRFDGTNDYLEIPNSDGSLAGQAAFTIALVFKGVGTTGTTRNLMKSKRTTSLYVNNLLRFNPDNKLWFYVFVNNSATSITSTSNAAITDANPHVVICTFNATANTMFLDGVAQTAAGSNAGGLAASTSTESIYLGTDNRTGTPADFYAGDIEQLLIYNQSLSVSRVNSLSKYLTP